MVQAEKTRWFSRFRRGKANKLDNGLPESAKPNDKSESPTLVDDTDPIVNNDNKNENVGIKDGEVTPSQLKAVRFPASDALKTTPGRSRRELQKPPTAREAAYGGPPRYDWIDIVSVMSFRFDFRFRRNHPCPIFSIERAAHRDRCIAAVTPKN